MLVHKPLVHTPVSRPALTSSEDCSTCDGTCVLGDVTAWQTPELEWIWRRLAQILSPDGDRSLSGGSCYVMVPRVVDSVAVAALLGDDVVGGTKIILDLGALARVVSPLTPGAIAAHSSGNELRSARRRIRAQRIERRSVLRARVMELFDLSDEQWETIARFGWPRRCEELLEVGILEAVKAVLEALPQDPSQLVDRRAIAQRALGNPHALDRGRLVSSFVLAILRARGLVSSNRSPREAWREVGVLMDGMHDGCAVVGISPEGIVLAEGLPVVLPPRVLANCAWPKGRGDIFVTENPSIFEAAVGIPGARVLCTLGTPCLEALSAMARLAENGWTLRVRADFDAAGLEHVGAILTAAPTAQAWRMGADDYLGALRDDASESMLRSVRELVSPWDPGLAAVMTEQARVVNEEALWDELLGDIAASSTLDPHN